MKIPLEQRKLIRDYYATHTQKETAKAFGVPQNMVHNLARTADGGKFIHQLAELNSKWSGKKLGRLTIISIARDKGQHEAYALSRCDCGNTHWGELYGLTHGRTLSCGCLKKENWAKNRCTSNPNFKPPSKHYVETPAGKTTLMNACKWFGVLKSTAYYRIYRGVHPITGLTYK